MIVGTKIPTNVLHLAVFFFFCIAFTPLEIIDRIYDIKEEKSKEKFTQAFLRMSEAALSKVLSCMSLSGMSILWYWSHELDAYSASLVCRGWYVVVSYHTELTGLSKKVIKLPHASTYFIQKENTFSNPWKKEFSIRHKKTPLPFMNSV